MLGLRAYRVYRVLGVFGSRAYKVYSQGAEKKRFVGFLWQTGFRVLGLRACRV